MITCEVFLKFTTIITTFMLLVRADVLDTDASKLVLSPMDFAKIVKEREESHVPQGLRQSAKKEHSYVSSSELPELTDDESRLRRRKVWSRWGKWGECSVTCGGGTMTRHRVCMAGHCAPGEHEDQCRPCARSPCSPPPSPAEDSHDLE